MRPLVMKMLVMAVLLLGFTHPAQAKSGVEFINPRVKIDFGESISFSVHIESVIPITKITLFFRNADGSNTNSISLQQDETGEAFYRYDIGENVLRPFADMVFWYQVTLENGETIPSQNFTFSYEDNRFPWRILEEGVVRIHWYAGDDAFGQAALDSARAGIKNVQGLFPVVLNEPLDVYIYDSALALQDTLNTTGQTWIGGHASPSVGVALVSIAPGEQQNILMRQQIPHELAHILLYRHVGEVGYNRLPTWLQEGVSSITELYPNPDYQLALDTAIANDAMIPIADLCAPFPLDASQTFLAYAEASSFTRYLHTTYGSSGLDTLIRSYADGLDCEVGMTQALGVSLSYLDSDWRKTVLNANQFSLALRNIAPYLVILGLILVFPLVGSIVIRQDKKTDDR